jgi:hypothetical protein
VLHRDGATVEVLPAVVFGPDLVADPGPGFDRLEELLAR